MGIRLRPLPISRTEIHRRTALSLAHVSKVFSGKRKPSSDAAQQIAHAMGWTTDQLFDYLKKVRANMPPTPVKKTVKRKAA